MQFSVQSHSDMGCLDFRSLNFSLFSFIFSIDKIHFNFLIALLLAIIFAMVSKLRLLEFSQEGWLNLNFFRK